MSEPATTADADTQRLDALRDELRSLKLAHDQLRAAVAKAINDDPAALSEMAKAGGTHPSRVEAFLKGETAILGGHILQGIAKACGQEATGKEIVKLAKGKSERTSSLVIFTDEMLDLYINLAKSFAAYAKRCTFETFAQAFDPYHERVAAILRTQHEALRAIQSDADARQYLVMAMEDGLAERVEKAITAAQKADEPFIDRLKGLMERLQEHYGHKEAVYAALGIPKTTYRAVMAGLSSAPTIKALIAKCEQGLRELGEEGEPKASPEATEANAPATPPAPAPPAPPSDQRPAPSEPHGQIDFPTAVTPLAGITSEDGVNFTITAEGCRRINVAMAGELIEPTRHAVTMVRAMLNLLAQTDDPELRKAIQKKLNPEVVELTLTIEYFTARIPNEMLPLIEEKRRVLADMRARQPKK